jgi:dehydrogenase/reductase SDR family protein 7B
MTLGTSTRIFFFLLLSALSFSGVVSALVASNSNRASTSSYPPPPPLRLSASASASASNQENYDAMLMCDDATKECFRGKNILLTGASGGLGRELAFQLAQCGGASTLLLSGRNQQALEDVAKECKAKANNDNDHLIIHILPHDLADKTSVENLCTRALELCPTIDVLLNNGGVSSRSNFLDTRLDVDERVMQINFFAGAALAKAVVPGMIASNNNGSGGGKIIWISSVQGLVGIPSRTSYAASKFAVQGYCEGLRAELASSGVSVHVASPGYIKTNLSMSAVTGDGTPHGKMDETTSKGSDPKEVAVEILNAVAKEKADFVVAAPPSAIAAIWLRLLCPGVLRFMLVKRFEKSLQKVKKD